jgi:hypothetical protein
MLPNLQNPEFELKLPSTGEVVHYRPFLVKEEKILLIALEGGSAEEITNAIYQIIRNCVRAESTDVMDMTYFDIEYIFLNIRAKSIDNIIKLKLSHGTESECTKQTDFELDINDVDIVYPNGHERRVMLDNNIGLLMKYPSLKDQQQIEDDVSGSDVEKVFTAIATCIENVFDTDNVYEDSTLAERIQFLENLTKVQFDKILAFYRTLPALQHEIKYTCDECGKEESITLRGMQSFFA